MNTLSERIIYLIVFSLLIFSPIPYGSIEPWAKILLQVQAFLLLAVYAIGISSQNESGNNKQTGLSKVQILLLSFLGICVLQIIPLPAFILKIISGQSLELWQSSQEALSQIGHPVSQSLYTISVYPQTTWNETVTLLAYFVFGYVISKVFRTRHRLRLLLIPVFAVALFESAYGIFQYVSAVSPSNIIREGLATGTFVNRNHYAGFLEMSIPLALGFALSTFDITREKSLFRTMISTDRFSRQILYLFLVSLMLLALLMSLSRMGLISVTMGLVFFALTYTSISTSRKKRYWFLLFIVGIAVLYGTAIGLHPLLKRFLILTEHTPTRILVWKDMLSAVADYPLFGTGLGTFSNIYLLYNRSIENAIEFVYAHNDYLQLLVETGIIGFTLIIGALSLFLRSVYANITHYYAVGDNFRFATGVGALASIISILIHSLADFNLHIPSNALYVAFLVGYLKAMEPDDRLSDDDARGI